MALQERAGWLALATVCAMQAWVGSAGATFPGPVGQVAFDVNHQNGIHRINSDASARNSVASPPSAVRAAWSPDDRTIAYSGVVGGNRDIYTVRFDGTDTRRLTTDLESDDEPAWSPDGARIVFTRANATLHVMNATGTLETPLHGGLPGRSPNWSPDGNRIVYATPANRIAVADIETGAVTQLTGLGGEGCCDGEPNWSPDGQKIAFSSSRPEAPGIYTMNADGSAQGRIRDSGESPAWSPDGTMIAFTAGGCGLGRCFFSVNWIDADGTGPVHGLAGDSFSPIGNPDWGSFRPEDIGYPRPKQASPVRLSLVPAYDQCNAPNRVHGPPLDSPSCAPPVQSSTPMNPEASGLTVGTPDANGVPARSVGRAILRAQTSDVGISVELTDVRCRVTFFACPEGPLSDYERELQGWLRDIRVTDHEGAPSTIVDLAALSYTIPCSATPSSDAGATCAIATSINALIPGAVVAGERMIWRLGQFEVFDGGGDGQAEPDGGVDDNERFAAPGILVP